MCYVFWCILRTYSLIWFLTELGNAFVQVAISMFMTGRTFFIIVEMLTYTSYKVCQTKTISSGSFTILGALYRLISV